ncbi:hypothetical protein Cantr_08650 [Candida viswanathii]|uniref:ORC6 first cyclin-like domain-containing protein n=1 Tax=Candida viswanathii TaxID=5486 RepID=A0A367Y5U4_9ASCO|nr:hypothetical protein Cantr_08650 [Candida viswanathii]
MSTFQAKKALEDILSNYSGEHSSKLLDYTQSLYQLSLRKQSVLPNKSEIARFHLCAFVVAEKYQASFSLPVPDGSRIPVQPKIAEKLLTDFREFINQVSAASTPVSSPKKVNVPSTASPITPSKSQSTRPTSSIGSPLKRLQAEMDSNGDVHEGDEPERIVDPNNPFKTIPNPKSTPNPKAKAATPKQPPKKRAKVYKYDKKHVLIPDFIAFCNTFHIPAKITAKMVRTFVMHQHKFLKKSEWSLACGMIHAAYIRINHKLLSQQVGAKTQFMDLMLQYQKGGLTKWAVQSWCGIIEDWVKDEPWLLEIESHYMFGSSTVEEMKLSLERKARIGQGWELMEQFGAMIHGEHISQLKTQDEYYKIWSESALNKCADS